MLLSRATLVIGVAPLNCMCTRGLTDRAIGYGPIGWGFESLRVYHKESWLVPALFFYLSNYPYLGEFIFLQG